MATEPTPVFGHWASIEETSLRSCYDVNESMVACLPQVFISVMKCIICDEPLDSTVYGCCKELGHPICKSCYYGCLALLSKKSIRCPFVINDKQKMCGAAIISLNFEVGIPPYWQNYLDNVNLQSACPSSKYGCDFVGQSEIGLMTHSLSCNFKHLRECKFYTEDIKACGASFDTIAALMEHLTIKHNYLLGKKCNQTIRIPFNYSPETAMAKTEDKWSPLVRVPTPYADKRYCLILVDENATSIRIWITDVVPIEHSTENVPYSVKAPVLAVLPDITFPSFTYQFTGKMLPYMTPGFKDAETDIPYFQIPKNFIRPHAQPCDEKGTTFRIFINFDLSV
ncbi:hypothetical protein Ocin01_01301 [Orchesella cincta]|uniref:Uncharacterized protein n=1 Tax=Orchesella cincta TaxID=48709 RepID=A0A1D2NJC3_ORCCI|nr:hypothetical protein Ocin01_01301 [Orchesella cincta]